MPGGIGHGGRRERTATLLAVVCACLLVQTPSELEVGRVRLVAWPGQESLGGALAEYADRAVNWPGLPESTPRPLRIVLTASRAVFDSVTRGRVPEWGVGAALPAAGTIFLRPDPNIRQILHHELAHVELRRGLGVAMPRWFEEGYASYAANEWGRLDVWRLNWRILAGGPISFREINRSFRRGAQDAEMAYALSMSVIGYIDRLGGDQGLEPLFTAIRRERDLDAALRAAHGMTLDQFERRWWRDVRGRYGWLRVLGSVTTIWVVAAVAVIVFWLPKRRRNLARRAALDREEPDIDWLLK